MRCPKCNNPASKPKVLETRTHEGSVYRRRSCGFCFKNFVTVETAPEGLRMPETRDRSRGRLKPGQERFNTQHLMDLWR